MLSNTFQRVGQQRPGSSLQINGEDKRVSIPVLLSALFVLAGLAIAARESIFATVRRGMCRIHYCLLIMPISDEAFKLHLEDSDSIEEHLHILMADNMEDFPEDDSSDQAALFAARIAKACITDKTRSGHVRQDPDLLFQILNGGFYESSLNPVARPSDAFSGGLAAHDGLKKTKAKAGEASVAEQRAGIVRYCLSSGMANQLPPSRHPHAIRKSPLGIFILVFSLLRCKIFIAMGNGFDNCAAPVPMFWPVTLTVTQLGHSSGIQFRSMSSEGTPLHTISLQSPARSVMDNVLHIMQADALNQLVVKELDPHNVSTGCYVLADSWTTDCLFSSILHFPSAANPCIKFIPVQHSCLCKI
ncbi:hypothetical protein B0H17DRAFT_1133085 [Mycena rosella]|uniref:Uncharacterized protein n=1 Tax=Mycena rosella TaxID=1033263 RepID=A0AAD7DJC9_MYCRO|nr:hypothetical protein B0H17DRAFT_1133085 [Mycena rosella]